MKFINTERTNCKTNNSACPTLFLQSFTALRAAAADAHSFAPSRLQLVSSPRLAAAAIQELRWATGTAVQSGRGKAAPARRAGAAPSSRAAAVPSTSRAKPLPRVRCDVDDWMNSVGMRTSRARVCYREMFPLFRIGLQPLLAQ